MSKKSYKRHQNRLYREIKRRIIAEKRIAIPLNVVTCERKIETLKVESIISNHMVGQEEIIKTDMARRIVNTLIAEGYVEFYNCNQEPALAISDCSRIIAKLNVVKPW